MGTRSMTTFICNFGDVPVASIYQHWDGYPENRGKKIHEHLGGCKVVNGYFGDDDKKKCLNGMDNAAARYIHKVGMDNDIDSCRLIHPDTKFEDTDCQYHYIVSSHGSDVVLEIQTSYEGLLFKGKLDDFPEWLEEYRNREGD